MTLSPGFPDPILDAQRCFRAVLEAMSRPGRVRAVDTGLVPPAPIGAAAGAVLLTLADSDTPVWLDCGEAAAEWIRFHCGCATVSAPGAARFVLAAGCAAPALDTLDAGTDEEPHASATLILQVGSLEEGAGWRLTGPGIRDTQRLHVTGVPDGFLAAWSVQRRLFPRGIDVILCAGDRLAALPRTVRIEEG